MSNVDRAESQLAEIELLTSMFPTQEELEVTDQLALAELRGYVEGTASTDTPPQSRPQFLIKQKLDATGIERVTCYYCTFSLYDNTRKINMLLFYCSKQTDVILSCAYPPEYPRVLPEITVR